MSIIYQLFLALRPKQRIKNLIILLPVVFSGAFLDLILVGRSILLCLIFSLFVGATYIINDIYDVSKDQEHPTKRHRPIASGKLPIRIALPAAIGLIIITLCGMYLLFGWYILVCCLLYVTNTYIYTAYVKHQAIIDVFSIALGFVLRGVIGTIAIQSYFSFRFLCVLFFGALFLGFLKRYQEVHVGAGRKNLDQYNATFLQYCITTIGAITLLAYSLYTFHAAATQGMIITIPFVVYFMLRYAYHIFFHNNYMSGIEDIILHDKALLVCSVVYVLCVMIVLTISTHFSALSTILL